jgi:hypothetical protein
VSRPTSLAAHRQARKAAARPAPRTVTVDDLGGAYAGWSATMRVDWPAGWMQAVEAGELAGILMVLDRAVTTHNMPDADGNIAATMAEVDPASGMALMASELLDRMGKLPPR